MLLSPGLLLNSFASLALAITPLTRASSLVDLLVAPDHLGGADGEVARIVDLNLAPVVEPVAVEEERVKEEAIVEPIVEEAIIEPIAIEEPVVGRITSLDNPSVVGSVSGVGDGLHAYALIGVGTTAFDDNPLAYRSTLYVLLIVLENPVIEAEAVEAIEVVEVIKNEEAVAVVEEADVVIVVVSVAVIPRKSRGGGQHQGG